MSDGPIQRLDSVSDGKSTAIGDLCADQLAKMTTANRRLESEVLESNTRGSVASVKVAELQEMLSRVEKQGKDLLAGAEHKAEEAGVAHRHVLQQQEALHAVAMRQAAAEHAEARCQMHIRIPVIDIDHQSSPLIRQRPAHVVYCLAAA